MLGLAMAMLLQARPAPPPEPPRPSVITNPDWLRRPTGEDLARYYPEKAQRDEMEGRATVSCTVTAEGTLAGCTVDSESPADYQFGLAALRLSSLFLMRPMTKDGQPVAGGTVRIPIRFMLPKEPVADEPIPTLAVATRCYGFAAARLEGGDGSSQAMVAYFGWRMMVEMKLLALKTPPSQADARLAALRTAGLQAMKDPAAKAEREKCDGLIKSADASSLDSLLAEVADKP